MAQIAVMTLVPPGADLRVAVDDSVFRRSGRTVHGAAWQHDGSSPSLNKISYGTCFVAVALLVTVPFRGREIGLPVLVRLHVPEKKDRKATKRGRGAAGAARRQAAKRKTAAKKGPSKAGTAAALVSLLATAFPDRIVHAVAACRGPALRTLPPTLTWT